MGCSEKYPAIPALPLLHGKRVLYVCEYGTLNGGERSLLAWLPWVKEAGATVDVLAPRSGPLAAALENLGIEVAPWQVECQRHANKLAARRARLRDLLRRARPDLIHANSLSMARTVGPVAGELGIPSIGHLRDIIRISAAAMDDVNHNARVLAVSQATADWHVQQGLQSDRCEVLYNGVDLGAFAPQAKTYYLHRELGLPPETRLLGAIGQIGMRKGLDVLLQAMGLLADEFSDVHLLVVGARNSTKEEAVEFERRLRAAASQPPLVGRVHFLGYREDVPRLLHELTLLLHAARQEPLGRVLLEAAAAGVPIVATDVGGTREIFPAHQASLVPPGDAAALANEAAWLLRRPDLQRARSSHARKAIESNFSADRSAAALLDHYRALI